MSVQKKKLTKRKVRSRRSHHALKKIILTTCPKCKQKTRPHVACPSCGYYKGVMVIDIEKRQAKKRTKAEQRRKDKEQAKTEAAQAKSEKTNKKSTSNKKDTKKVVV